MTQISNQNRLAGSFNLGNVSPQNLAANAKLIDNTLKLMGQTLNLAGKVLEQAGKALGQADTMGAQPPSIPTGAADGNPGCFPTEKPSASTNDSQWGTGASLKTDADGKIHTPGGYTIEPVGQFEWKITGPDKQETRVWGDPHVQESDGGSWQFKKNTEFVLGDGTRIDVTTKPYGNGATVTGQLDIVNGDSHVAVTDIDKGKGKTGPVTSDGDAQLFKFGMESNGTEGADHVYQGKTTADWVHDGHEIIGSDDQGATFKTKDEPAQITQNWQTAFSTPSKSNEVMQNLEKTFKSLGDLFKSLEQPQSRGFNPFRKQDDFGKGNRDQHLQGLNNAFKAINSMLQVLQRQFELSGMLRSRGTIS